MTRLTDFEIEQEIADGNIVIKRPNGKVAKPKGVSLDLHLGPKIKTVRVPSEHQALELIDIEKGLDNYDHLYVEQEIPEEGYVLEPNQFILAATDEAVTIPDNMVGWLDGKSKLGRAGICVHVTAHRIDPGWADNVIVLEIYNMFPHPIILRNGMSIAAITFEELTDIVDHPYKGNFANQKDVRV